MSLTALGKSHLVPEKVPSMSGIQFLVDEQGEKTAVVISLKKHGELWEDFYDALLAAQRENEPAESLADVKKRLRKQGKLSRQGPCKL